MVKMNGKKENTDVIVFRKHFFCSRNRESFLQLNYLLVTFFYFKVTKTNLKRKLYQHQLEGNKPI